MERRNVLCTYRNSLKFSILFIISMNELKRALTVRAKENVLGLRPPSFKVYKELPNGKLQIPRFFRGDEKNFHRGESAPMMKFTGILRPHQKEALESFNGNGVLCLPCGAGKTATAIAIACQLKRKTIIIVHKEFLANQWRERISQFCTSSQVGLIQGDTWDVDGKDFVIAMIQTLCVREHSREQFKMFGLVIVDEAHHVGAPAFSKTMFKMTPEFTLGLTATPERKDGLTCILYWFLGKIFYEMNSVSHIPEVHKIDFDHHSYKEGPILNKFGKVSMAHMVNKLVDIPERNELILKHLRDAISRGRKILLLSDRRGHCEWFYENLGPEVSGLYLGGMKQEEHERASQKQVIVATFTLAYEGLDIPELDTLFLVTPHSDVKQAVGRIMRSNTGTKEIFDFVDKWSIFSNMFYRRKKMYFPPVQEEDEKQEKCLFD
jgi:superfamily II DNA or RNA helicase